MRSMKLDEYVDLKNKDSHISLFLDLALIAGLCPFLMIYRAFLPFFAPNFVKFDPWVWHKKRSDNIFSSFSLKGYRA